MALSGVRAARSGHAHDRVPHHRTRTQLTAVWTSDNASPAALAEASTLSSATAECQRCAQGGATALRQYAEALAQAQQAARGLQRQAETVDQDTRTQLARSPDAAAQILQNADTAYRGLQSQHQQAMDTLDQAARRARTALESLTPNAQAGTIGSAAAATRSFGLPPPVSLLEPPIQIDPDADMLRRFLPWLARIAARFPPWMILLVLLELLRRTIEPVSTAPRWRDELNPVTGRPYTDEEEYDRVKRMTPEERERERARLAPRPSDRAEPVTSTEDRDPDADRRQGKVPLGASDMSRMALDYRLDKAKIPGGAIVSERNVAVFEIRDADGNYSYLAAANVPGGMHSEEILNTTAVLNGVDRGTVTRIYSERQPCTTDGHECSGLVGKDFYPNAKVTWGLDWREDSYAPGEIYKAVLERKKTR